ncbi:hypothetical protein HK101_000715 [Irineochytrium annulatum]|nr:hypothetical protein HK101_000715 [Irineochytrium annulatum]
MIQVDSPPPAYETDDDAAVFGTETEPPAPSLRIDTTYSTLHRSDAGRKPPLPIPRHLNLNRSDTRSSAGGSSSSLARSNTDASASSAPSEVREWDVRRVCGWLRSTGFDDAVVDVFRKKGVDGSKIGYLTAETLKTELGIRELGVRIRIVDAIRDLN